MDRIHSSHDHTVHNTADLKPSLEAMSLKEQKKIKLAMREIYSELMRATARYPKMASFHEGYAIIAEELEELWAEVKKKPETRDFIALRREAVQTGAMVLRFLYDLCE